MPQTRFKFINDADGLNAGKPELMVEIGGSHIAFIQKVNEAVSGFEMYSYTKDEAQDVEELFEQVSRLSSLSGKEFNNVDVFFNTAEALITPAEKFNDEISGAYLSVVFGDAFTEKKIFSDKIGDNNDLVTVYRAAKGWINILQQKYRVIKVSHVYSGIINKMLNANLPEGMPVIKVQLYQSHIIVAVVKNRQLQIIQSFEFKTAEDVQYYLLSIVNQLGLIQHEVSLQLSGMIDEFSPMYTGLIKYFKNIVFDDYFDCAVEIDISGHPAHYYTPFFNLSA